MSTIAYQGHPGAFSDVAARYVMPSARTQGYPSFDAAVRALVRREADFVVLPVENAIAGPVPRNYELLWENPSLCVRREITLSIELCLIGTADATIDSIQEVRSHPVALDQVRRFIDDHGWRRSTTTDTAGAVREVLERGEPALAAVGPALAAESYGGTIIARGVQDDARNYTRFFLVSRTATPYHPPTQGEPAETRACVGISVDDRPGSLRDALGAFADRRIDLRFLIARPDRQMPFRYRFFVELANVDDERLHDALGEIGGEQRILGRYEPMPRIFPA